MIRRSSLGIALLALAACGGDAPPPEAPQEVPSARPADPLSEARPPATLVIARRPPESPVLAGVAPTPPRSDVVVMNPPPVPERPRFSGVPATPVAPTLVYTPVVSWTFDSGLPADWTLGSDVAAQPAMAAAAGRPGGLAITGSAVPTPQESLRHGLFTRLPAEQVQPLAGQSVQVTVAVAGGPDLSPRLAGTIGIENGERAAWRPLDHQDDDGARLRWTLPLAVQDDLILGLWTDRSGAVITAVELAVAGASAPDPASEPAP